MASLNIQAVSGATVGTISRAIALAAVIFAGAGAAQAADSTDRIIPPSPADVAILRGLLALQHPALRQGGSAHAAPNTTIPAVTTEPSQPTGQSVSSS